MKDLAIHLTLILSGLRVAIGAYLARRDSVPGVVWLGARAFIPVTAPLTAAQQIAAAVPTETWTLLWTRIGRMAARFQTLFDRWRAGALPKPDAARPGRPNRAPAPRLPTRHAWIVAAVGYQAAGHASQLSALMAQPEFNDFIAAVPQSGRLLRPLCRMLGITPAPPGLARPTKPRPPRQRTVPEPRLRLADLRRPRIPPPLLPFRKKPT